MTDIMMKCRRLGCQRPLVGQSSRERAALKIHLGCTGESESLFTARRQDASRGGRYRTAVTPRAQVSRGSAIITAQLRGHRAIHFATQRFAIIAQFLKTKGAGEAQQPGR